MRVVLVSSPGPGPEPHWSHAVAGAAAVALVAAGHVVVWFPVVGSRDEAPVAPAGISTFAAAVWARRPVSAVAAGSVHVAMEMALAGELRAHPAAAFVHLGVGARGSTNLLWLAERMGAQPFAVLRADEIVCPRGDLRHRDGSACTATEDPDRCRRCLAAGWFGRPPAVAIRNRRDLLLQGLLACRTVLVPGPDDVRRLAALGVPERVLQQAAATCLGAELAAVVAEAKD